MNEPSAKRSRQKEGDIASYAGAGGVRDVGDACKLAGCHLDVKVSTGYIFLGQPVEVEVRLLNDEDLIQRTTVSINVTVIWDNQVRFLTVLP